MQNKDPRATVIGNVAQDRDNLDKVLKEIPSFQKITFDDLIQNFGKCFEIRQQPQFIEAIFKKKQIYNQFVMWILSPLKIIQARQKAAKKQKVQSYKHKCIQSCVRIAKKNPAFYESLYIAASEQSQTMWRWFQFLKYNQVQTFQTSLGYFIEIMLPFLKQEFSDSSKICDMIRDNQTPDFLVASTEISRQQTQVQLERMKLKKQKTQYYIEQQISILKIFTDELFEFIVDYIHYEGIMKFLYNLILVSLQQTDLKRSKKLFQTFLQRALTPRRSLQISSSQTLSTCVADECKQQILQILNQILQNANTQKNYRVIFFIDSIVRLQLINTYIERILEIYVKDTQQKPAQDIQLAVEQEQAEFYLKSLSILIKIYSKMVKAKKSEEEVKQEEKFYANDKEDQITGGFKVIKEFQFQIQIIFQSLPDISNILKQLPIKFLPFSSGQNIRPVTLYKYEFFQLIYNCLVLGRQYPDDFIVDTQKINIFSIIEKYLAQNRWNNIAHKILQKIACLLTVNNKNFFRTKQMSKNNMADQFLNSIIQSFTNKKYIFLNSFKFTTQGNIHTLYVIAKAIIYQLKQSHKLANFIHSVDYYKKFVITDLQQYQSKIFELKYPADQQDLRQSNQHSDNQTIKIQVDQLSIQQIVKKIDIVSKWPVKQNRKARSTSMRRSLSYMSDDFPMVKRSQVYRQKLINPLQSQSSTNLDFSGLSSNEFKQKNANKLALTCKTPNTKFKQLFDTRQQSQEHIFTLKKTISIVSEQKQQVQKTQNAKQISGFAHSENLLGDDILYNRSQDDQREERNQVTWQYQRSNRKSQNYKLKSQQIQEQQDFMTDQNILIHISGSDKKADRPSAKREDQDQSPKDVSQFQYK